MRSRSGYVTPAPSKNRRYALDGVVKLSSTPTLPLPYTLASSRVLVGDLRRPRSPRAREANWRQPNLIETQTNIVPANIVVSIRACRSSSLLVLHLDDLEELCHLHRLARVLIFERQLNFQRLWHISLLLPGLYQQRAFIRRHVLDVATT